MTPAFGDEFILAEEKRRRGFSAKAYLDPEGVWRIGYGELAKSITQEVTEPEAEKWLREELGK